MFNLKFLDKQYGTINCLCGGKIKFCDLSVNKWFCCDSCGFYGNEFSLIHHLSIPHQDVERLKNLFTDNIFTQLKKQQEADNVINYLTDYKKKKKFGEDIYINLSNFYKEEIFERMILNAGCWEEFLSSDVLFISKNDINYDIYKSFFGKELFNKDYDIIAFPHYFFDRYVVGFSLYYEDIDEKKKKNKSVGRVVRKIIDEDLVGLSNYYNVINKRNIILTSSPLFSLIYDIYFRKLNYDVCFCSYLYNDKNYLVLPHHLKNNITLCLFSWSDEALRFADLFNFKFIITNRFSTITEIDDKLNCCKYSLD